MVSVLEMVVNQYIPWLFLERGRLFGEVEKMLGNVAFAKTNSSDIHSERGGTETLAEHLFVPKGRNILKNMMLQFMIDIIVVAVPAQAHHNGIYIFEG